MGAEIAAEESEGAGVAAAGEGVEGAPTWQEWPFLGWPQRPQL